MSKHAISIGETLFSSKSQALAFYKNILNSYEVDETLSEADFKSVFDLVYRDWENEEINVYQEETGDYVQSIQVTRHPDFKATKCFVLLGGIEKRQLFSYILSINGGLSDSQHFSRACRHLVAKRLRVFKEEVFKNRPVRCAITNEIVEWEDCQIDHKAPLTFSVIVKSFIVAHKIDVSAVEYFYEVSKEQFVDTELAEKFEAFHKGMAVLRGLSTKQNLKLSGNARIKPTKKDGVL